MTAAPFAYYGGKAGMAARIVSHMPAHRVYIEPFFGSGAVLFAKPPARHEIVNDLDAVVVTFFRVLRERRAELEEVCALSPHSRVEFEAAVLDEPELDELEVARRFWVRVNQSFAKTAGVRTGWSITTARTQSVPASVASRLGRFAAVADRLMGVSIEQRDACDLVAKLATADAVVYADPPYLASTRTSRASWVECGEGRSDYRVDMHDEASHIALLEVLRATPATVLLSGYRSPLYDELLGDWWAIDVPVAVHSSNARTNSREGRVETLWCNRPMSEGRLFH